MIYPFECPVCKKQEEKNISIKDYDNVKTKQYCTCGAKMVRVFTNIAGVEYKCQGFYTTNEKGLTFV
jgi:predicted nucleic acid-binding Zn ribbon protein